MCVCCAGSIQELSLIEEEEAANLPKVEYLIRLDPAIFCNLKRLLIKINGQIYEQNYGLIHIHIPAAVHLDSLQIYADVFGLSFEDAMVSCTNLTDVTAPSHRRRKPISYGAAV